MTTSDFYFGVAVYHPKTEVNIGSLWRTAHILGAAFLATIGERYTPQASDTTGASWEMPLWSFDTIEQLAERMPRSCPLVGVELCEGATMLHEFHHPPRCIYLLGAEDHGIPRSVLTQCQTVVRLPGCESLNLAVAGSIVIHDRVTSGRIGWQGLHRREA